MKVTILSSLPPIKGGISKYAASLAESLAVHHEVEALNFKQIYPEKLYPGGTKDSNMHPPESSKLHIRTILTWYNPLSWIYAAFSLKGDIVHAQWWTHVLTPVYITILGVAKFLRRKKIVLTIHNVKPHEAGFLSNLANKIVYRFADHFIVHSEDNKRTFVESCNVSAHKVSVVPIGILMPDAPMKGITQAEARRWLKLPAEAKVVLFFGIIREYKGLDTLIEAMAQLRQQVPDTYLIIAGKPWESWEQYQQLIEKHKLQTAVHCYLEFIPEADIGQYFSAADVMVLPYRHFDSQSAAGALALPFGKAMAVTNVGGLPQNVRDERAVCQPDDPAALASVLKLIFNDEKLRHKLEKDSATIAKELSWGYIAQKTAKVYKEVL